MYNGLGIAPIYIPPTIELTSEQLDKAKLDLPACYDSEFDTCWQQEDINSPVCSKYSDAMQAWSLNKPAIVKLVDDMPYCDYNKDDLIKYVALSGIGGIVVGGLVGIIVAKLSN